MSAATAPAPRRFVSPLARRVAAELGVSLDALRGSGPNGRIVRRDVERAHAVAFAPLVAAPVPPLAAAAGAAPAAAPAAPAAPGAAPAVSFPPTATRRPLTRIQQVVARRMTEAKAGVPEFAVRSRVRMDAAVALRRQLAEAAPDGRAPSYNDLIVKACALALREHPRVNGRYDGDAVVLLEEVDVGIAVAADESLVVPVIREADRLSVAAIASEARRLAGAVRDGTVAPAELAEGTFTVSNLGMFGVTSFEAILNQPQAAILAVGELREEPVVRDGAVVPGTVAELTLTADHRILYGADAARFLGTVRDLLQAPLRLLM